jgi:iron complex transport system ATP-binding protein
MTTAIALSEVTFGYAREPVVRDVTFSVGRGEFIGIIGPNGSGKSTLMRLMTGLLRPWRGAVAINGTPLERYQRRELGRLIGVVPQETAVSFPFSVMETVLFGRTPHLAGFGFESESDLAAARRAMARTGTADLARRAITELSGGERQRVILARALAQEPSMLLLDEPAAFLDVRHEVEMYDLLRDLQRDGMTIVSVLHDLNIAALYCERLILLHEGRIARAGAPAEVITYSTLTEVYGTEVYVAMNDITGSLNVLPLSREHRERLRTQFGPSRPGRGE